MEFWIKRYLHGFWSRSYLLILVLVPIIAYLILAALIPDRFSITQQISISESTPVSVSTSPIEFQGFARMVESPSRFFRDPFALRELEPLVEIEVSDTARRIRQLQNLVSDQMSLEMADEEVALVSYLGPDRSLGRDLVEFYSGRLVRKADEGIMRAARELGIAVDEVSDAEPARLIGEPVVTPLTAWWRSDRWSSLFATGIISLLFVLILVGIVEWSDPSFKSERDVGRYLGVPVLGAVPNLKDVSKRLGP